MITREQVADLRPGDVVELAHRNWHGATVKGPLHDKGTGYLCVGDYAIARPDGEPFPGDHDLDLTVISRAPRLYVNHDRTEPVAGDVARPELRTLILLCRADHEWVDQDGDEWHTPPRPLRLLVDGETGQVVP